MNLREKTVKGAKWSAVSTLSTIGIGFLQMTLLARLFDTHQFGLLSIAIVILLLADTLSDFGLSNSIIQRKEISKIELSTLYWINIVIGLMVSTIIFIYSGVVSEWLRQPDLKVLIQMLALAFLIIPHGQQFRALLQKELEFQKIGFTETLAVIMGFMVTMITAHHTPQAITAIWGYLMTAVIRTLMFSWYGRKIYRPCLKFSFRTIIPNLKFGIWLTADSLLNQLNSNLSTALLSRMVGAAVTGGFNLAYNVAVAPPVKLNPIITRVLFPAFAKIQDDQQRLRQNFYKLLSLVGLLNFPLLLGVLVVAPNFVLLMFGEKWQFITPMLQVLCVVGVLRAIGNPIGSLLMAKARMDISFKFNFVKFFFFIAAIWLGVKWNGGLGAAVGFLTVQVLNTWLSYLVLIRPILGNSFKAYLSSIWLPLRLALPTVIVAWAAGFFQEIFVPSVILAIQVVLGGLTFLITILISRNAFILEIKHHLLKKNKLSKF